VTVGVERQLRGGVTKPRGHGLDVDTRRNPETGRRVAQVVGAAVAKRCEPLSSPATLCSASRSGASWRGSLPGTPPAATTAFASF
jgi:hypothetical protein